MPAENSYRPHLVAQTPSASSPSLPQRSSSLVNLQAYVNAVAPPAASEPQLRNPPPTQLCEQWPCQSPAVQTVDRRIRAYDGGKQAYTDRLSAGRQTMTSQNPANRYPPQSYPSRYDHTSPWQQPQDRSAQQHPQYHTQRQPYAQSYPFNQQRPLVDLVTNEWQNNTKYSDHYSDYSDDDYEYATPEREVWPNWMISLSRIRVPRRVQRGLLAYLLFLLCCWFVWLYWLQPSWEEEKILDDSLTWATTKGTTFGSNIRPAFTDMVHLQHLDSRLVPGSSNQERRLVFIGDVHGCKDERMFFRNKFGTP